MDELTDVQWLEKINEEAEAKAREMEALLVCEIKPVVYVVEPLKDAAVAFLRLPDAKQTLKLLRAMAADYESGCELIVRSQLVRNVTGYEGICSDARFMNEVGQYDFHNAKLNASLVLDAKLLIDFYVDEFKKK